MPPPGWPATSATPCVAEAPTERSSERVPPLTSEPATACRGKGGGVRPRGVPARGSAAGRSQQLVVSAPPRAERSLGRVGSRIGAQREEEPMSVSTNSDVYYDPY